MTGVTLTHVWKSYQGAPAVADVTLTLTPERPVCLMAPSGTGKTTLLRLLLGLERPDRGEIRVPPGWRWSAVFQEDRLLDHLDAWGNLRFVLGAVPDGAPALLEALGLSEAADRKAAAYSGGMRRRLALARALLAPFDGLVLDEPFTGLDGGARERCLACIRRAAAGRVLVLSSHDPADAAGLSADILRL